MDVHYKFITHALVTFEHMAQMLQVKRKSKTSISDHILLRMYEMYFYSPFTILTIWIGRMK